MLAFPALFLVIVCLHGGQVFAQQSRPASKKPTPDHSGEARKGKASYYGKQFYGRTMADGTPMNPHSNVAASRTLPLGTRAEVRNLVNGKSEIVVIKDRGPYIDGRIIDLSPRIADKLGMRQQGVVPVEVRPLHVPQPDGSVKLGVAALEGNRALLTSGE
ncbi:septal ring lytic transglycosylase RlpA family protein [Noviherbaspirillum cavernae]|uniref:Endolytic peptidoglycan transglycosylase RlpA n=1 Tax=Noviherbaspirillum cavernae TaxID=2320862 RepID=A0A418X2H1_9BURK|nr:septal ring lytic transglycosylase RlpA family protein [Noviherbaspirillum cavernae]RJG06662.1 septal ring lytic transglycosylase RlpA family protein [Noviherbaspirillum cavernae]